MTYFQILMLKLFISNHPLIDSLILLQKKLLEI